MNISQNQVQERNLVIITAGGGNDVFSGIAYLNSITKNFAYNKIILVGILGLTPIHLDIESSVLEHNKLYSEQPIIFPTKNLKRFLLMHKPKEIYASEKILPELLYQLVPKHLNIECFCLSSKYGAKEQAINLINVLKQMDCSSIDTDIDIVDFGGDILTDGKQSSIISPELDAFTLAIVRHMTGFNRRIVVCFPGVDGELDKMYLKHMCENVCKKSISIDKKIWYENLTKIYAKISLCRPGNTIPNMLKILTNNDDVKIDKSFTIDKTKFNLSKKIDIDFDLQDKIYIFDINIDNPYTEIYNKHDYDLKSLFESVLDIYNLQNIDKNTRQLTDLHLQYLRKDMNSKFTNKELILNNNDDLQDVMFINILPYHLSGNPNCIDLISILKTYDERFAY